MSVLIIYILLMTIFSVGIIRNAKEIKEDNDDIYEDETKPIKKKDISYED